MSEEFAPSPDLLAARELARALRDLANAHALMADAYRLSSPAMAGRATAARTAARERVKAASVGQEWIAEEQTDGA